MAIAVLTSNETGANSLIDINANFADLDTTKADLASPTFTGTPTLPTGTIATTQTVGDSSTKIATTAFVQTQIAATPAITCVSEIPTPVIPYVLTDSPTAITTNTTARLFAFRLPFAMTVNKISIKVFTTNVSGTYDLTIYSEDGQTQKIAVTTGTISGAPAAIYTTAVSSVVLTAGMYWFMINSNSTASADFYTYVDVTNGAFNPTASLASDVSSEPVLCGTLTITAGTPPTTFTPSSITEATLVSSAPVFRLDN